MRKYKQIRPEERDLIALWKAEQLSIREIARRLKRSHSSILSEIKRNNFGDHYVSIHAQARVNKRMEKARRRHSLKNKSVYGHVLKKLRGGWSPEQISGRLKLKKPNNSYWHIHHETIYRYIYASENKDKNLFEYLPRKQKRRKKKYGRTSQRIRIPDRVSIHERPEEVETREVFGHWEGDSIEGRAHKGGIHTQVERKTRYIMASLISTLRAPETAEKASSMFDEIPENAKKSTTLDNGKEFTNHKQFGLTTYFADPYSSWQRGTNENSNGLIRRYLPKKTDLTKLTQEDLDAIIDEINNRPRKCLGFYTAKEMFDLEINKGGLV